MTSRAIMNVDLSDPSDLGDIAERMIEYAVEEATAELKSQITELEQEVESLTYELKEARDV